MMKKRLLSLFLAACLLAALLPAAVLAAEPVIELNQAKLNEYLGEASLVNEANFAYSYKNPLPAGSYRLTGDVVIKASIVIEGDVTLDLNGKHIKKHVDALCGAIRVMGTDASLTLTDSSEEKNGAIDSFQAGDAAPLGGGVYVDGGTFVMTGGTIFSSAANSDGGGVYLTNGAVFTMTGGAIQGCRATYNSGGGVYVGADCTFMMQDGVIENCSAGTGDSCFGGGVYVAGSFLMTGGAIRGCSVIEKENASGGGVYVTANAAFTMTGGSIENCFVWDLGGGVYAGGTFEMTGGHIKNCSAWGEGSGVYVANGASATLITENITGNKNQSNEPDDIVGSYEEYVPPVEPEEPEEPEASETPKFPFVSLLPILTKDETFTDVSASDWFYSDVNYVYENGLMTGTAANTFSPDASVTRGMVMTILARRNGVRTDRYTPWYAAGCEWAKANGVSDGTNPEAAVTREQLAAMLYRYAKLTGRDLTSGTLDAFTDGASASTYALDALQWAAAQNLLTGSNGTLAPQGLATRAQLAAILHRFFG